MNAKKLEENLREDPFDTSALFDLARSYADEKDYKKALEAYRLRSNLGKDSEEVFWSFMGIAEMQKFLGAAPETVLGCYRRAWELDPSRAEPLFWMADYYISHEEYLLGYLVTQFALRIPKPKGARLLDEAIYDHKLLLIFADCACNIGQGKEALQAWQLLLTKPLPPHIHEVISRNIAFLKAQ